MMLDMVIDCDAVMLLQGTFPAFFQQVIKLKDEKELQTHEKTAFLVFMINCFQVILRLCH